MCGCVIHKLSEINRDTQLSAGMSLMSLKESVLIHIHIYIFSFWLIGKFVSGYKGLLSGVTVRPGNVEPHSVVECLYACREGLDFGDLETLGSGMKVLKVKFTSLPII